MVVTLNGMEYDFSNADGVIGFVFGGHLHGDYIFVKHDIPVINVTNFTGQNNQLRFDLVLVDWVAMKIHLTRIGDGRDRSIDLARKS